MSQQPITVNIFDFGFSVFKDNPGMARTYTPVYAAPELFDRYPKKSVKLDVFAMARIIALLWRVDPGTYILCDEFDINAVKWNASNINLDSLFTDISDLSEQHKNMIKETLLAMFRVESHQRISIEEAIGEFVKINLSNGNANELVDIGRSDHCFFKQIPLNSSIVQVDEALILTPVDYRSF